MVGFNQLNAMGRAPCCEKNGLKRGPWMPEEDQKLVEYIRKHGQGNWRTLPKNAGELICMRASYDFHFRLGL